MQLRNAAGIAADVSIGTVDMSVSGTDATLGEVTDNGDGTYTVTLTAGATPGTATVTASVQGSALEPEFTPASDSDAGNTFAAVAQVVIEPASSPSTPTTVPTDLPDTGGSPLGVLLAASVFVLVGLVTVISRRRVF